MRRQNIDLMLIEALRSQGVARVLIFAYKDTQVPGMVAGMAVGGALRRIGYNLVYGRIDQDPKTLQKVMEILRFYKRRAEAAPVVVEAIRNLAQQKYLACGGMSLKMCTTADVDQWAKLFGITYEALDQSELRNRALPMVQWEDKPGESKIKRILDPRVQKAFDFLYHQKHGRFDFSRDKLKSAEKFISQLAFYYAALDLIEEYGITFAGIKCQDELSAIDCTQCVAAAFLNNDVGPNGKPEDDPIDKLKATEYLGQEIFYDAGGSAVRGRTP